MTKRNENRPGYKKTKVGWIPKEWECVRLKEVSDINPEVLSDKTDQNYMFHYIDLSAVNEGKLNLPSNKIAFCEAPSRARRKVKKNDVLLATVRPNLKGFAHISFEANDIVCSTGYAVLRSKNEVISLYLFYNLFSHETERYFYSCVVGSNYPALNNSDVNNLRIPLPPLSEQKKIAEILSAWDRAIEQMDKLIDAEQRLKKGLMQQLLTGRMRFPGFGKPVQKKDELPEDWKEEKLEEVSVIKKGEQVNISNMISNGKYYVLNGGVNPSGYLNEWNTPEDTITISEGGNSCGFVAFNTQKFWCGGHCYSLKIENDNVVNRYLYFFLKLYQGSLSALRVGSGLPNIQRKDLYNFPVKLPSLPEQTKIANILSACDKEIDLLKKKKEKLKEQKKGLMQKLLTGEVRYSEFLREN